MNKKINNSITMRANKQQGGLVTLLLLFLTLIYVSPICAQLSEQNRPLEIGDPIPELVFSKVINHPDSMIRSSDWEGKLVILSFWATWCTVCIEKMPEMVNLQEKFKDDVLIILITEDDYSRVSQSMTTSPILKNIHLPMVTGANLKHLFPHRIIPHEVWISPAGKFLAATGSQEITFENIQKVLKSTEPVLENQKKDIIGYNHDLPFMSGGLGDYKLPKEKLKYSRIITDYIPGISSFGSYVNKYNDRVTIKLTNSPLQRLYIHALAQNSHAKWPVDRDYPMRLGSRLVWEAADSTLLFSIDRIEEYKKIPDSVKLFNYEIVLPRQDSLRVNELMLHDLNEYFGNRFNLIGKREARYVDCWVLIATDSSKVMSKGGRKRFISNTQDNKLKVCNMSVDEFMFYWQGSTSFDFYYYPLPIINETGITGSIDLNMEVDPSDFKAVKKAISAYGLEFKRQNRLLDMIVIQDRQPYNN